MNIDKQFFDQQNKTIHPYAEKIDSNYDDQTQTYNIQIEEIMIFEESISIPRIKEFTKFFENVKTGQGSEHVRFRYSARIKYELKYQLEDHQFIFRKPAALKSVNINDIVECHNSNINKNELYDFIKSTEDAFIKDQTQDNSQIQQFINHQNNFNINES